MFKKNLWIQVSILRMSEYKKSDLVLKDMRSVPQYIISPQVTVFQYKVITSAEDFDDCDSYFQNLGSIMGCRNCKILVLPVDVPLLPPSFPDRRGARWLT